MQVIEISDALYEFATSASGSQVLAWKTLFIHGAESVELDDGIQITVVDDSEGVVSGVIADDGSGALIVGLPQRSSQDHESRFGLAAFDSDHRDSLSVEFGLGIPIHLTIARDGSRVACLVERVVRCYDLRTGRLSWEAGALGGLNGLQFSADGSVLTLLLGSIHIRLDAATGSPIDAEEQARLAVGREPFEPLIWVEDALRQANSPTAEELDSWERIIRAAIPVFQGQERAVSYPSWEARAWRCVGKIYELRDAAPEALDAYEHALRLDPGVGVSRRVKALRLQLSG